MALPLVAVGAVAQPPAPGGGETIDVRVVDVDARVTDAHGEPVHGLAREDFRLRVDGRPVAIEFFVEVRDDAAVPRSGVAAAQGRSFLVLIDDSLAVGSYRDAVIDGIERSLQRWDAADQMAVLVFDGHRADVLSTWTSDRAQLTAALERARQQPAQGALAVSRLDSIRNDNELVAQALANGGGKFSADNTPEEVGKVLAPLGDPTRDLQTRTSIDEGTTAVTGALRALVTPPGHKAVLLVSAGWALASGVKLVRPLIAAAAELGYALYPVDASISMPGSLALLDWLARPTGGAVLAVAQRDAFARLARMSGSYYSLGFTPTWRGDDRRHGIVLEPVRRDLVVRARAAYADLSPAAETTRRAASVALLGGDAASERLHVTLEDRRSLSKGRIHATIVVEAPVDALRVTTVTDGFQLGARLAMSVVDAHGGRAERGGLTARTRSARVPEPGDMARFRLPVTLRDVPCRIAVALSGASPDSFVWGLAEYLPGR